MPVDQSTERYNPHVIYRWNHGENMLNEFGYENRSFFRLSTVSALHFNVRLLISEFNYLASDMVITVYRLEHIERQAWLHTLVVDMKCNVLPVISRLACAANIVNTIAFSLSLFSI